MGSAPSCLMPTFTEQLSDRRERQRLGLDGTTGRRSTCRVYSEWRVWIRRDGDLHSYSFTVFEESPEWAAKHVERGQADGCYPQGDIEQVDRV